MITESDDPYRAPVGVEALEQTEPARLASLTDSQRLWTWLALCGASITITCYFVAIVGSWTVRYITLGSLSIRHPGQLLLMPLLLVCMISSFMMTLGVFGKRKRQTVYCFLITAIAFGSFFTILFLTTR